MLKNIFIRIFVSFLFISQYSCSEKLKDVIISSDENSKLLNNAFDGNFSTFFKSAKEENCYIGLDLSDEYLITKIGWSHSETDNSNYLLGIFEGSNDDAFLESIPLYMITSEYQINTMIYFEVTTYKTFRYVRYIGPDKNFIKYQISSFMEKYLIQYKGKI